MQTEFFILFAEINMKKIGFLRVHDGVDDHTHKRLLLCRSLYIIVVVYVIIISSSSSSCDKVIITTKGRL